MVPRRALCATNRPGMDEVDNVTSRPRHEKGTALMEWVLWGSVSVAPIILGVLLLRHIDWFVVNFGRRYPRDTTRPTFEVYRGVFRSQDPDVLRDATRGVGVGAIIVGFGMLLALAFAAVGLGPHP